MKEYARIARKQGYYWLGKDLEERIMATRNRNMSSFPQRSYQERKEQSERYDNLAVFVHRTSWHLNAKGQRVYPYMWESIRRSLAASRVLTKDGEVRQERMEKWAKSRGIKTNYTVDTDAWGRIVEGES